jgi:hypothetical protein
MAASELRTDGLKSAKSGVASACIAYFALGQNSSDKDCFKRYAENAKEHLSVRRESRCFSAGYRPARELVRSTR